MAPLIPLVTGRAARDLAQSQGFVWGGITGFVAIGEHVETSEAIDQRGDREMRAHLIALTRAAAVAKREGAYVTHSLLVDEIARTYRLIEIDDHEDLHRRASGARASDGLVSLQGANGVIGRLIGQREALSGTRT